MGTDKENGLEGVWKTIYEIRTEDIGKKVCIPDARIFEDLGRYYVHKGNINAEIINYPELKNTGEELDLNCNYDIYGRLRYLTQTNETEEIRTIGAYGIKFIKLISK